MRLEFSSQVVSNPSARNGHIGYRPVVPLHMSLADLVTDLGDVERLEFVRFHEGHHSSCIPSRDGVEIGREIPMPRARHSPWLLLTWGEGDANVPAARCRWIPLRSVADANG